MSRSSRRGYQDSEVDLFLGPRLHKGNMAKVIQLRLHKHRCVQPKEEAAAAWVSTLISEMRRSSANATCNMGTWDQGTCPAHPWLIGSRASHSAERFMVTIPPSHFIASHLISLVWVRGVDFWYFVGETATNWFFGRLSKFGASCTHCVYHKNVGQCVAHSPRILC